MPKWIYHPLTALVLTILAIWLYSSLLRTEQQMRSSAESVTVLDQEVATIAKEVSGLENRLMAAQSETAQEEKIRNELLLQKPGEYVIQLPTVQEQQPSESTTKNLTAWGQWQQLLGLL